MTDFRITDHGSVWHIQAQSRAAKQFAREHFAVEGWQGCPGNFFADHRPARHLCERLVADGFTVTEE
jgi:hypothetical protein